MKAFKSVFIKILYLDLLFEKLITQLKQNYFFKKNFFLEYSTFSKIMNVDLEKINIIFFHI
jgi:hypothetical protein